MTDQSKKLDPKTLQDTTDATFLRGSGRGTMHLTEQGGEIGQSGRPVCHASLLAAQEKEKGVKTNGTYCQSTLNSSKSADLTPKLVSRSHPQKLSGLSLRLLSLSRFKTVNTQKQTNLLNDSLHKEALRLLPGGSMIYTQKWKKRVTPSGTVYWAHTAAARRTSGRDSTGWHTPRANDAEKRGLVACDPRNGNPGVAGWPTTAARDTRSNSASMEFHQKRMEMTRGKTLAEVAGWATPNTMDVLPARSKEAMNRQFSIARKGRTAPANLREQVRPDCYPNTNGFTAETTNTGQLNPALSRWLMGLPPEWCVAAIQANRLNKRKK